MLITTPRVTPTVSPTVSRKNSQTNSQTNLARISPTNSSSASTSFDLVAQENLTAVSRNDHKITMRAIKQAGSCGATGLYITSVANSIQEMHTCGSAYFDKKEGMMTLLCPKDLSSFNNLKLEKEFTLNSVRRIESMNPGHNGGLLSMCNEIEPSVTQDPRALELSRPMNLNLLSPPDSASALGLMEDEDDFEGAAENNGFIEHKEKVAKSSEKIGDLEEGASSSQRKKINIPLDGESIYNWFGLMKTKAFALPTGVKIGLGVGAAALTLIVGGVVISKMRENKPDVGDALESTPASIDTIPLPTAMQSTTIATPQFGDICKVYTADKLEFELKSTTGVTLRHPNCDGGLIHQNACGTRVTSDEGSKFEGHKQYNPEVVNDYNMMFEKDCQVKYEGAFQVNKGSCNINKEMLTKPICTTLKTEIMHSVDYCEEATLPKKPFKTEMNKAQVDAKLVNDCEIYDKQCEIKFGNETFPIKSDLGETTINNCLTHDSLISSSKCKTINNDINDKFKLHNSEVATKYNLMREADCIEKYKDTDDYQVLTGECEAKPSTLNFASCKSNEGFRSGNAKSNQHAIRFCKNGDLPDPINARDYQTDKDSVRVEFETKCNSAASVKERGLTVKFQFKGKSVYSGRLTELYAECPTDVYAAVPCDTKTKCGGYTGTLPTYYKNYGDTIDGSFSVERDYCNLHAKGDVTSASYSFDITSNKKSDDSYCIHTWGTSPYGDFQGSSQSNC